MGGRGRRRERGVNPCLRNFSIIITQSQNEVVPE
jgi:hypothetical protein